MMLKECRLSQRFLPEKFFSEDCLEACSPRSQTLLALSNTFAESERGIISIRGNQKRNSLYGCLKRQRRHRNAVHKY